MIELNKVGPTVQLLPFANLRNVQKFRAYVLDSDRAMDVFAYLMCYGLEIKDKPGTSSDRSLDRIS